MFPNNNQKYASASQQHIQSNFNIDALIQLNLNQPMMGNKHQNQQQQQQQQQHQQQQINSKNNKNDEASKKKEQYIQSQKQKFKNYSSSKSSDIDSFANEIFNKMNQSIKTQRLNNNNSNNNDHYKWDHNQIINHQNLVIPENSFKPNENLFAFNDNNLFSNQINEINLDSNLNGFNEASKISPIISNNDQIVNAFNNFNPQQTFNYVEQADVSQNIQNHPNVFPQQQQQEQHQQPQFFIPFWCHENYLPLVYKQIFAASRVEETNEISTDLVYPILLLSNIERPLLGKIWSLVNLTIPGRLLEHELYMALALIGLAQKNIEINDLSILYHLTEIPIPNFDFSQYNEGGNNNNSEIKNENINLNNNFEKHDVAKANTSSIIDTSAENVIELVDSSINNNNEPFGIFNDLTPATVINNNTTIFESIIDDTNLFASKDNKDDFFFQSENSLNVQQEVSQINTNNENDKALQQNDEDKYSFFKEVKDDENTEEIWIKCLKSIETLYDNVYSLFSEFCLVDDDYENQCSAIVESSKGKHFMLCLYETYLIIERIQRSAAKINLSYNQVNYLLQKNQEIFKNLLVLLKINENDLKLEENIQTDNSHKQNCSLCLDDINSTQVLITFSSNTYHNTCINFWLNLVDELNFPNLKIKTLY